MKYHKQLFRHDPDNGIYGDCHRTAIACVLDKEIDDVPNFMDMNPLFSEFNDRVNAYLYKQGLKLFSIAYNCSLDDLFASISANNPTVIYLLGGTSPRGTNHTVVCRGGEIIHDTAIDGGGLVGPMNDGYYWVEIFTPIF